MKTYAPDSDVLIALEKADELESVSSLGTRPIVVTEFVWDEVAQPGNPATVALLTALAGRAVELPPQSPEAASMVQLQTPYAEKGKGEASIIAWALHHPDVIPIFLDRLALFRGVEELHEREVLSLHGFLRILESWGLASSSADNVSKVYCRSHVPITPPLWWSDRHRFSASASETRDR